MWCRPVRSARVWLAVVVCLVIGRVSLPQAEDDGFNDALRQLRRAIEPQRDGSHLAALLALRHLRDPALRPLFERLVDHSQWQVQVHALLALAESSAPQRVRVTLIQRVPRAARERVIAEAIDQSLIGSQEILELLAWPELEELPRLLLLAEREQLGEVVDRASLEPLTAEHVDANVAGIAAALLAQKGDPAAFSAFRQRLEAMSSDAARDQLTLALFDAIRQYELPSLADWVATEINRDGADPDVRYWGLFTLLCVDQSRGLEQWPVHLGPEPGYGRHLRYALLLLRARPSLPPRAFDLIRSDDSLLHAMAQAGRAITGEAPAARALIDLLNMDHLPTADWVMSVTKDLPAVESAAVYAHIIDSIDTDERRGQADRTARAVEATARLFELQPDSALNRLQRAADDSLEQQVLVLGLFDTRAPKAGEAAAKLKRIGVGRADALALMLMARHDVPLSDGDRTTLARIAGGGVRVASPMQAQAAWLYLKSVGRTEDAYRHLLSTNRP